MKQLAIAAGLVFAATACVEDFEPEHLEYGRTGSGITKGSPGASNGDLDYCNDPANTCDDGEGDCDGTFQCTAPLVCGRDNGPKLGFPQGFDICVPQSCTNGVQDPDEDGVDCGAASSCGACDNPFPNGHPFYCTSTFPCIGGEGDCDRDSDCMTGTFCASDNGSDFGFAPSIDVCIDTTCTNGVVDNGEAIADCGGSSTCGYCPSSDNGHPSFCSTTYPCRNAGEGDCDGDATCTNGLECGVDNGPQFGMGSGHDVCVPPSCLNGVQDDDESGIDCGGDCGTCL